MEEGKKVREVRAKLVQLDLDRGIPIVYFEKGTNRWVRRLIIKRPDAKVLTLEDLEAYVEWLNLRFPTRKYELKPVSYQGRILWSLERKNRKFRVPIYFDLERQAIFVQEWQLRRRYRYLVFLIFRTLGSLRVTTSKYLETIR